MSDPTSSLYTIREIQKERCDCGEANIRMIAYVDSVGVNVLCGKCAAKKLGEISNDSAITVRHYEEKIEECSRCTKKTKETIHTSSEKLCFECVGETISSSAYDDFKVKYKRLH